MEPSQAHTGRREAVQHYAQLLAAVNTDVGLGQVLHQAYAAFKRTIQTPAGYGDAVAWNELDEYAQLLYAGMAHTFLSQYEVRPRRGPAGSGGTFNQRMAAQADQDERPRMAPRHDKGRTLPQYQVIKQAWLAHLDTLLGQRAWSDEELRRELLRLTGVAPSKGTVNRMKHGWVSAQQRSA